MRHYGQKDDIFYNDLKPSALPRNVNIYGYMDKCSEKNMVFVVMLIFLSDLKIMYCSNFDTYGFMEKKRFFKMISKNPRNVNIYGDKE